MSVITPVTRPTVERRAPARHWLATKRAMGSLSAFGAFKPAQDARPESTTGRIGNKIKQFGSRVFARQLSVTDSSGVEANGWW